MYLLEIKKPIRSEKEVNITIKNINFVYIKSRNNKKQHTEKKISKIQEERLKKLVIETYQDVAKTNKNLKEAMKEMSELEESSEKRLQET